MSQAKVVLEKLEIEHYRGFFEKQIINFAIPVDEKEGSGLTIVVGPNNTGKTTIIESLLLDKDKKFKESERHPNISPIITIKSSSSSCKYTNIDNGSQLDCEGNHNIHFEVIQSRRYWQQYSANIWDSKTFAHQSSRHETRNSSGLDTAAVLKGINQDKDKKAKLNEYMKELVSHFSNWTIDTNDQGDYVKYGVSGREHQAGLLGDGIISLFRICAHLVNEDEGSVFIIDEPELSLHPAAQKVLAKLLSRAARNKQIILCTHSPYFINWKDFSNGAKFIRLNKINDIKCEIFPLNNSENYANYIKNNLTEWQKPQMLDIVAKELLFAEKILFVEGQQDVGLIRKWLKENNKNENFDIFGYGVGGYSNMRLFLEMAKDLGLDKVAALYDSGSDANRCYEEDCGVYSNYFFKKLSTSDIKDKLDGDKPKQGIFDESGNMKEEHREEFESIMQEFIKYFD